MLYLFIKNRIASLLCIFETTIELDTFKNSEYDQEIPQQQTVSPKSHVLDIGGFSFIKLEL